MKSTLTIPICLLLFIHAPSSETVYIAPEIPREQVDTQVKAKSEKVVYAEVSGYTSSPEETWGDPHITASGERTGPGTLACPRDMAFGTQIEIAGDVYTCNDRMNKRYEYNGIMNFDIWFADKSPALKLGRRQLEVKILE